MSESLSSRVSRLIAGSFHALVDAVEGAAPEAVMEQAIREVEQAAFDVRADLGKVEAQRHLAAKRLAEESQRHEGLTEKAQIALSEGRDDLAAVAVERQMDIEAQLPVLEARLAELGDERTRLEGYVSALQAKKREMSDELASYRRMRTQQQSATATAGGTPGESVETRAERAAGAFERVFQRETGLGSTGAASQNAAQLAELEDLARRNRVAERLAQLKAKAGS